LAEYGWQNLAEYRRQNKAEYSRQNKTEYYGWQNTAKYGNAISTKEELLVSAAATNPITIVTNMPANQPYNKTPCQSAYGTDPAASTVLLPKLINTTLICLRNYTC
jgi:hypothetical protein